MGKLVPISELQNWELTDEGVLDKGNSGVSVNIYKVACTNREVKTWIQPLLCAANRGLITLLMRQVNNKSEFLLSYQSEFGISGEKVLLPSYIIYPGENHQNKTTSYQEGKVLSEVIQSEEGGRFYLNENIYQVILVDRDFEADKWQFWVDAEALKGLLKTSNQVSIQLRCITSLILKIMNPNTLGDE
jgi:oxidase EvaA